jgi:hypothetical protein
LGAWLIALLAVCMSIPSSSSGWEWVPGPPKTEPRPWVVAFGDQPEDGRKLQIETAAGYCAGETPPFIHHLDMLRKPKRVVIRVHVRWPKPLVPSGAVEPGDPSPACAGQVRILSRVVKITRRQVKLLDGYYSPPQQVTLRP